MSQSESPSERRAARKVTPNKKRMRLAAIAGGTVVVLVAGGLLAWQFTAAGAKPDASSTKTPSPKPTAFATPAPGEPVALSLDATASDEFDWWAPELPSPKVNFLASDDAHEGAYSLAIKSQLEGGTPPDKTPILLQSISAVGGMTYDIGYWVKSSGTSEDAIQISPSPFRDINFSIPSGAYDWTFVSNEYQVPPGQSSIPLRIVVRGESAGTWIDSVVVTERDGPGQAVMNSSFESHSAELTITNKSLLLTKGKGEMTVASRRSDEGWFQWSVSGSDAAVVEEGESLITGSQGKADLSSLPVGMYTFSVRAMVGGPTTERQTSFAVVDKLKQGANESDSPFGVFLHYLGGESRLSNMVDSLAIAGIRHARVEMTWQSIERTPGQYTFDGAIDSTLQKFGEVGITPLMVPVYANSAYDGGVTPSSEAGLEAYARFAGAVASHYAAIGHDVEVYNEFDHVYNSGSCGHTASCYVDMMAPTAKSVKAANPEAIIVGPGNSGMGFKIDWLKEFFALGGLEYTDVVSAHPYVQPEPPEKLVEGIKQLSQIIKDANGGQPKPIWLTEMGWATVPNWVTKEQQADYLVRTMALSLGHGVERVYWFEAASLNLNEGDRESNFGLFDAPSSLLPNTNAPKLAAVAQSVMARKIQDKPFSAIDATSSGVHSYVFGASESSTRVMWAPDVPALVDVKSPKSITVTDIFGVPTSHKPVDGVVRLELTGSPVYVEGAITGIADAS